MHQFNIVGGRRFCFSCNALCESQYCGAQKLVEFSPHNRVLKLYHLGTHKCHPKIWDPQNEQYLEDSIKIYGPALGPKELAKLKMDEELRKQMESRQYDFNKIREIGSKFTDSKKISMLKKKLTKN